MREFYANADGGTPVCRPSTHPAVESLAKMLDERVSLLEKLEEYNRLIAEMRKMLEGL